MRWSGQSVLVVLAVAFAVAATPAQASRIFLSTSGISPLNALTGTNPSIVMNAGQNASLYLWWQPTIDSTATPARNEKLDGWSHDIVSSNPILSATNYVIDNPSLSSTDRWDGTSTGTGSSTFMIDDANAITASGSNLGFATTDPTYDSATQTWRMATLNFHANSVGTDNIFLGIGMLGIAFVHSPANHLPINFGFGDAAIESNMFGAQTTMADATVTVLVPEPSTLALIATGVAGLFMLARRRARA